MTFEAEKPGDINESHFASVPNSVNNTWREGGDGVTAATDGSLVPQISAVAEAKLRWKIDLYVVPTVALLYLFCFIDRANVGNAKLAGFEKDLNMTGYDYNGMLSVFYTSYTLFEIPANLLCKWMGPGWFLPLTTLGFGICSIGTAFVHTLRAASVVRFLLGIFEAGMVPGIAYYLSRWYRRDELSFRLSLYIVMAPLAGAFGGMLASAILRLPSFGSLRTWRMIFAIEGTITCCLSVLALFTLTDRPESARWLTPAEKVLAAARIKAERIGTTEVLDSMDARKLLRGISSPVTLGTGLIFLLNNITVQGLAFFAPTIVKTIYPNISIVSQQLRTVPPYVVGAFFTLLLPFLSWRYDRRIILLIVSTPPMVIGYIIFLSTTPATGGHARYAATFLIASGAFTFGSLCNAQASANVVSDTSRSAAIATVMMLGNIGGLISTWSFLPTDAPEYRIGNSLNLATTTSILIVASLLLLWIKHDNRARDARSNRADSNALEGLSRKEVQGLDWKHPAFRWNP